MTLEWIDGQPFSTRFGDVYFSGDSGLEESRHVFLRASQLAERFVALLAGESFCIGETGFGTGLNFLCAWQLFEKCAPAGSSLDFFSVEKFPFGDDDLRAALALWPELYVQAAQLQAYWHRRVPGWNRWNFAGGRVRLTLAICDVTEALPQLPKCCVDAWFLDGFSPAKNPEMWSDVVLESVARASRAGATLATFTSAGWVRRGLQQAGFEIERVPGFGHKREMVRGVCLSRPSIPISVSFTHPLTALVIGGGIAGCAAAHALAQRGITVTLVERSPQLASAASGNPRGILHARFGAGDNPLHRFVLASYGHALGMFDQVLPADGSVRAECGLLQLACKEVEVKRIARLSEQSWPEHLLQFVDAAQATQLAGVEMKYGGLWFPAGGWVVPSVLCSNLANDAHITQRLGYDVETLEKIETGWRASGHDVRGSSWEAVADVVLVCCAHSAKKLAPFLHFPLIPVRGQITELPETAASKVLQSVVCGDGYCAPALDGVHLTGATHAFDDESTEVRPTDHAENLANLAEYAPALHKALTFEDQFNVDWDLTRQVGLKPDLQLSGRASIRCSAPGSMPLVGEVQEGLYCSLAHGTRGLLTAGLAAEVLAAQICGQLMPLPVHILNALAPLPRVRNKG
jgi:tRNA 5-methylaminomethyl-2-thiouridine biosynthesis bifunctional protein